MRMARAYIVWMLLILHPLATLACPAETVLCRTVTGSVKVEAAINGVCGGQVHEATDKTTPRSTDGRDSLCPHSSFGYHGPCKDTLLTVRRDVPCPQSLTVRADNVIDCVSADSDCGVVAEAPVARVESIDPSPPWRQPDLDLLRTVKLLT